MRSADSLLDVDQAAELAWQLVEAAAWVEAHR